jgi:hypothetical protein
VRIIGRARRAGKTMDSLRWLALHPNGVLIVHDYHEKDRLARQFPELADRIFTIIAWQEGAMRGLQFQEVAIDNLDLCLRVLFAPQTVVQAFYTPEAS